MFEKVKRYIVKWHMIEEGDHIIVGVSGGADSVCLLFVLSEIRKTIPFNMTVVHVNHGLREEAAMADEAYVKRLCDELGIPIYSYYENVELIAKSRKQSTEEAGREVRRSCFETTMRLCGANKIALAHHKNDNVETMLFHLARGTGLRGLAGMKPVQGRYIRPFLCITKSEIEDYLRERAIFYCEDATNYTDEYTRNRIRNHIIPFMEREVNPSSVLHMGETMQQLLLVQEYMDEQLKIAYGKCVKNMNDGLLIDRKMFEEIHEALKQLVVKKAMAAVTEAKSEKNLEQIHVQLVLDLFEKQVGRQVDLPYQIRAKHTYDGVLLQAKQLEDLEEFWQNITIRAGNEGIISYKKQGFRYRIYENHKENTNWEQKGGKLYFDCDIIRDGLIVRTRQSGDYITIHSDGRTQKLKSFFINEKVPSEMRDHILLLADGSHILWIVGMRANCLYQAKSSTKHVLEVQVDKGVYYGRKN